MEEKKASAPGAKVQAKGPTKKEKMATAIIAVVFIVGLLIIALVQKANGAF